MALISGRRGEKVTRFFAPPSIGGGVVALTGAAETRLSLPSAAERRRGGRQDGSSGGAIFPTRFPLPAANAQTAA